MISILHRADLFGAFRETAIKELQLHHFVNKQALLGAELVYFVDDDLKIRCLKNRYPEDFQNTDDSLREFVANFALNIKRIHENMIEVNLELDRRAKEEDLTNNNRE